MSRPNIILIMVDEWRGDCLSIAGHPVVHTPFLDYLALDGARFDHAYSAVPTCIAARAACFTGLSQRSHGRIGYLDNVPWNYDTTLAGEFTRHGYQTQAIGKMHVYPERSQLGFQHVILHDGYLSQARKCTRDWGGIDDYLPWLREQVGREADHFDHGVDCNSYVARPWDKDEYLHPTNYVASQSIDFLRRRDLRKPFFLFMSFHRPHAPYDPPAWAFEQYLSQEMPDPPVGDWLEIMARYDDPLRHNTVCGKIAPWLLHRARAGYYGHMTHIDQQINRFLETLDEYNLTENTYICFVSDHGELIGDHHLFRKFFPYEGSTRVPLILKGPRGCGIQARAVHHQVIELRDIFPTLLDCAGLPIPDVLEGHSFFPIARGEHPQWREALHGEHVLFETDIHWVTDGHWKYVWWSYDGREQLFDLDNDPQECHDLARTPAAETLLPPWRQRLVRELVGREEGFTDGHRLIPGRPVHEILSHLQPDHPA